MHGEHDTNVPIGEARQIVAALEAGGQPVEYLELAGEGHEYRRRFSRRILLARMVEFLCRHLQPDRSTGLTRVPQPAATISKS